MLFQLDFISRIIIIQIVQLSYSIIYLAISYKILRRYTNRLTLTLSGFYICVFVGFIFSAIRLIFRSNPIVFIIYFIALYLILYSQSFLVGYLLILIRIDDEFNKIKLILFLAFYAILTWIILFFSNGFTIDESTNWYPVWSWEFLYLIYVYVAIVLVLPFFYFTYKLYGSFEDDALKRRLKYFILGFCGIVLGFYGGCLYNTWDNAFYRSVWVIISLVNGIISGLIIYYTFGRQL